MIAEFRNTHHERKKKLKDGNNAFGWKSYIFVNARTRSSSPMSDNAARRKAMYKVITFIAAITIASFAVVMNAAA